MARRARTSTVADAAATPATRCDHGRTGTCWQCCEDDMRAHIDATGGNAAKYFDGRNGEGTPDTRPVRNGGGVGTRAAEPATDAQVYKIQRERDRRDTSRVTVPADTAIRDLSKRAASELIDKLLDNNLCPLLPADQVRRAYAPREATPGQLSYVRDLLAERVYTTPVDVDSLTFSVASALIDHLIRAPRLVDVSTLPDGPYGKDGVIWRVRTDPKTGRKRCHRAVIVVDAVTDAAGNVTTPAQVKFRADQAALARLTQADAMTEAAVTEFGHKYGICVFGHLLSDPVSVAAGIGPKCAANMGIDQLAYAIANGYVPPVKRTRARRAATPAAVPAPAVPAPAIEPGIPAPVLSDWASL